VQFGDFILDTGTVWRY